MLSQFQETVHVVEVVCVELRYAQVLAAFTDPADAKAFAEQQDVSFTLVDVNGEEVWMPDRMITEVAGGTHQVMLSVPPWNDPRITRARLVIVVHEVAWNQMLGRMIPVSKDGHPGPTLVAADQNVPVAAATSLEKTRTRAQLERREHELDEREAELLAEMNAVRRREEAVSAIERRLNERPLDSGQARQSWPTPQSDEPETLDERKRKLAALFKGR